MANTQSTNSVAASSPLETRISLPAKLCVGGVAGVIGTSAIFPIDIVKTRLQNSTAATGVLNQAQRILQADGFRGFYKGLLPNLVGVTPEKAIKLAANDVAREFFHMRSPDGKIQLYQEALAGMFAGFTQVVATNPMEIVKIRMQVQGSSSYTGPKFTAMQVARDLGFRGLYKGAPATLLRDVPFSVLFFPLYSNLRHVLGGSEPGVGVTLLSGMVAGAVASGSMTPADVIKTRLQVRGGERYTGIVDCFKKTVAEDGWRSLFRGSVPRMAVQAPLFGIALLAFELQKVFISRGLKLS